MDLDLNAVIEQVSKEKGLDKEAVVEILEDAMMTAARRRLGLTCDLEAQFNPETNEIELFEFKEVVEEITDDSIQIPLETAKTEDPDVEVGDTLGFKISADNSDA